MSPMTSDVEVLKVDAQTLLHIGSGPHRAQIAPAAGGRLVRLTSRCTSAGAEHDWIVPIAPGAWLPHQWPKGGCYPLVPFSNRIRDGRFVFEGKSVELDVLEGQQHALHGHGQFAAWQVEAVDAAWVRLRFEHAAGSGGWPWTYTAWQEFRIDPEGLRMTISVRNDSDSNMPVGLGLHPYFTAERTTLSAGLNWVHEEEMAVRSEAISPDLVFGPAPDGYTAYLGEWDGEARLHWKNGATMTLVAGPLLGHVVVHRAAGKDYLCVEPVSLVCDAFNLERAGHAGTGAAVLAPHESVAATVALYLTCA